MANEHFVAQARHVYRQVVPELFRRRNVVGVGIGYKVSEGEATGKLSLIVSVSEKLPANQLTSQDLVPKAMRGLLTDVVETGHIRALPEDPRVYRRPAQPGISVGHYAVTAGTFGLVVERNGESFLLSNNHILANSNDAKIGDAIYQPGPADGGTETDRIATLMEFAPLDFGQKPAECSVASAVAKLLNALAALTGSSHRVEPVQVTPGDNLMDAALARPIKPDLIVPQILDIGAPAGLTDATLGLAVQKTGRTTGWTEGVITQIDATVDVDYAGRTVRFTDQVFTNRMSSPGDSGSAIVDMERNVVGLLFAGSDRVSIFTPIQRVLDRFGVTVVM